MAIVTRYFSTSAAGAADGTTWADRAALFDGSNTWAAIIDDFDFTGSDSLLCLIGPGSYTCAESLASAVSLPTLVNPLILHGCDSSGNALTPPDPDWVSAQPAWSDSTLPVIATSTNIGTINLSFCGLRLLKFTASGRNGSVITSALFFDWCHIINSTSNTSAIGIVNTPATNCYLACTGTSFDSVRQTQNSYLTGNCRISGNGDASSGNRRGIHSTATSGYVDQCTITGCDGGGFVSASPSASQGSILSRCVIIGNDGSGVLLANTASQAAPYVFNRCYIANNGAYGIAADASIAIVTSSRFRDNTSGNFDSFDNFSTAMGNYTTDSDDATEFVDAGAGDYRIKYGSAIWGMGYGAGDGPATIVG